MMPVIIKERNVALGLFFKKKTKTCQLIYKDDRGDKECIILWVLFVMKRYKCWMLQEKIKCIDYVRFLFYCNWATWNLSERLYICCVEMLRLMNGLEKILFMYILIYCCSDYLLLLCKYILLRGMKTQGFQFIQVGGCFNSFKKQGEHNLLLTPSKQKKENFKILSAIILIVKTVIKWVKSLNWKKLLILKHGR